MMFDKVFQSKDVNNSDSRFTMSVAAILGGLGAEVYIPIFRKYDIGHHDLEIITEEDLIILAIDSPDLRKTIINIFKNKNTVLPRMIQPYNLQNATQLLTNASKQLSMIKLAILTNHISLGKDKNPQDVLLLPDLYATSVMLDVIEKINDKLDDMSYILINNLPQGAKNKLIRSKTHKNKPKIIVGGALIVVLSICFLKTLKNL